MEGSDLNPNIIRLDKFLPGTDLTEETIRLFQDTLILDTQNPPGNEMPLAVFLENKIKEESCGFIKTKIIETAPNRGNLIITVEGSEPDSHDTWGFAAHLDVVPVDETKWIHPPFSAARIQEKHDEFIWGRGSFDMKHTLTAYMMSLITLVREGWRPKGNIKLIFESDEERGGAEGMQILIDQYWEDVKVDFLITEGGGYQLPIGHDFVLQCGEKGKCQTKLIAQGVSGHGSTPDSYDKMAMYKIIKVLQKIKKKKRKVQMGDYYYLTAQSISLPGIVKFLLTRKSIIRTILKIANKVTGMDFNKVIMPLIQDTIAPTIIRGGKKENVISPEAEVTLDIRILPGKTKEDIWNLLRKIIGKKLSQELTFEIVNGFIPATISPIDTKYYGIIQETLKKMYPKSNLVPLMGVGGTDMRFFRPKGVPCYGFTLSVKDKDLTFDETLALSHSPNERLSVTNLMLNTEFAYHLMKQI